MILRNDKVYRIFTFESAVRRREWGIVIEVCYGVIRVVYGAF